MKNHIDASDRQADFLLSREIASPTCKARINFSWVFDKTYLVFHKEGDEYKLHLDFFSVPRVKGVPHTANDDGCRLFARYSVSQRQIENYCKADPKRSEDVFRLFHDLSVNGNAYMHRGNGFDDAVVFCLREDNLFAEQFTPDMSEGFRLTDYLHDIQGILRSEENTRLGDMTGPGSGIDRYYHRVAFLLDPEPVPLSEPVPCPRDDASIRRVTSLTGIAPDNGVYTSGLRFTPFLACDMRNLKVRERFENGAFVPYCLCPNPYLVNEWSGGSVKHDMVISPQKAADLMSTGLCDSVTDPSSGKAVIQGVVSAPVALGPKHPLSKDRFYAGSQMYSDTDIFMMHDYIYRLMPSQDGAGLNFDITHMAYVNIRACCDYRDALRRPPAGVRKYVLILSEKDMRDMNVTPQYIPFDRQKHDTFVKMSIRELEQRRKERQQGQPSGFRDISRADNAHGSFDDDDDCLPFF